MHIVSFSIYEKKERLKCLKDIVSSGGKLARKNLGPSKDPISYTWTSR
jgi:hypothetical protein